MIQEETAEAGGEARDESAQAAPAQNEQSAQSEQKAETAAPEAPSVTTQAQAPAGPPKSQLRRRVEERMAELAAALEKLAEDPAKQKQARAIAMALKGANDWMTPSGQMGPMEAAQMSRWLVSTQYLVQGS